MIKRLFYIGVGMIILSFIVLIIGTYTESGVTSSLSQNIMTENLTLNNNTFTYIPFNFTNSSYIFTIVKLSKPGNLYLFNKSAYSSWGAVIAQTCNPLATTSNSVIIPCQQKNGLATAISLENKGAFIIYNDVSLAAVPPSAQNTNSTPIFETNVTKPLPPGKYFVVIDNTNGNAPLGASVLYFPPFSNSSVTSGSLAGITSQIKSAIIFGIIFFILLAGGIVLALYAFFKQPSKEEQRVVEVKNKKMNDEEINELYKGVDKKGKKRKRMN